MRTKAGNLLWGGMLLGLVGACGGTTETAPEVDPCDVKPEFPIDYAKYGDGEKVSFRKDVIPIFKLSCASSVCHDFEAPKTDLFLFDRGPTRLDGTPAIPEDESIRRAYESLLGVDGRGAPSKFTPSMKLVAPKDPAHSFLVHKITGQQNKIGLKDCVRQIAYDEFEVPEGPCGFGMPMDTPGSSKPLITVDCGMVKHDTIAEWIAQGAKNN